ncbi:hypothetical protein BT96DRAFT_771448, partial [Gymnopus androsaceus JB14]
KVFAVVCDGVTVRQPCCGVPHCKNNLCSNCNKFCWEHNAQNFICCIKGCKDLIHSQGSKTCADPKHQAAERKYNETGTAAFQLK